MTISFIATGAVTGVLNSGSSYNVAVPASVAAGDVMVMFWSLSDHCTPNTPTGWTILGGYTIPQNFNGSMYCYYKVAGGSEPANYAVTMTNDGGGRTCNVSIAAFRGVDNTTPINVFGVSAQQLGTAAPTSPSVTTTVANCSLLSFIAEINQHTPTLTVPSGSTTITSGAGQAAFKNAYNLTTGAAGSYTPGAWASSVANDFITMTIALAPAAGGGATATTLSGPSAGTVSVASTSFTVGANGTITGTVIVTPSDAANGGTFTPTTVSISSGTPTGTFTYTPASTGVKTISTTNNGALTNPTSISYTSNAAASTYNPRLSPRSGMGTQFYGA